jgi:hypothetical protein
VEVPTWDTPVPDPPPAGLAVAGGEVAAETLASHGGGWRSGAPILDGGEGGVELGELGGVLPVAGARRNRPAWVVAAARERSSWGKRSEVKSRDRGRRRSVELGGLSLSLVGSFLSFFLLSLAGWMDGWMWGGELDGYAPPHRSVAQMFPPIGIKLMQLCSPFCFSSNFFYPLGPTKRIHAGEGSDGLWPRRHRSSARGEVEATETLATR